VREAPVVVPDDDPGWPLSPRILLFGIPLLGRRQRAKVMRGEGDSLVLLRQVFLAFCLELAAFGIMLALLYPTSAPPSDRPTLLIIGLLAVTIPGIVWSTRFSPPLKCADEAALATSYGARFFMRMAFSDSAALFGFVGFFLTYDWWPYPAGVAIAAAGFSRTAPTRANLRRDQERLATEACFRSLTSALRMAHRPGAG